VIGAVGRLVAAGWNAFAGGLNLAAFVLTHAQWMIVFLGIVAAAWFTRDQWGRKLYQATLGQVACPDVRNAVLCGVFPCGWCIMEFCCPFICPKYHPPFRLRVIVVKAKRLQESLVDGIKGHMRVYAEVRAGTNPAKTTSLQPYSQSGDQGHAAKTVTWNEPIDMVMYPAATSLHIDLIHKEALKESWLGTANVLVDSFYKNPGACEDCHICGKSMAKLGHKAFGTEYRWPFARGEPSTRELKEESGPCDFCFKKSREEKRRLVTLEGGHGLFLDTMDKPPMQSAMLTQEESREKYQAIQKVSRNGRALAQLSAAMRSDKDVVLAAVRQKGKAIEFASHELQNDVHVQRVAAQVPRPMVVPLTRGGEDAGRLWVYFIMHGIGEDDDLPNKIPMELV